MKVPRLFAGVLLTTVALSAEAPTTAPDTSLMQALLNEVHALRLAMERSNAIGPRLQLALARYQLQQDKVLRKERELEAVRNQMGAEATGHDRMLAAVHQYEEQARQTADPAARKQFEDAAASARTDIEQQTIREQQNRVLESTLVPELRTEQSKLNELSSQMDRLDQLLSQQ